MVFRAAEDVDRRPSSDDSDRKSSLGPISVRRHRIDNASQRLFLQYHPRCSLGSERQRRQYVTSVHYFVFARRSREHNSGLNDLE